MGPMIMCKNTTTKPPLSEAPALPHCENGDISTWLTNIELTLASVDDEVGREYTNIGGQNGLELFV